MLCQSCVIPPFLAKSDARGRYTIGERLECLHRNGEETLGIPRNHRNRRRLAAQWPPEVRRLNRPWLIAMLAVRLRTTLGPRWNHIRTKSGPRSDCVTCLSGPPEAEEILIYSSSGKINLSRRPGAVTSSDARFSPHPSALCRPCFATVRARPGPFRPVKTASSDWRRF